VGGRRGGSASADHVSRGRDERANRDDFGLASDAEVVLAGAVLANGRRGVGRTGGATAAELNREALAARDRDRRTTNRHALSVVHGLQAGETHVGQRLGRHVALSGESRGSTEGDDSGECEKALHLDSLQRFQKRVRNRDVNLDNCCSTTSNNPLLESHSKGGRGPWSITHSFYFSQFHTSPLTLCL
jgi:hypothetical protein